MVQSSTPRRVGGEMNTKYIVIIPLPKITINSRSKAVLRTS